MLKPSAAPPTFKFSTKAFAKRAQLAALRDIFGRTVCSLDIAPLEPATFSSDANVYRLPGLGVMFSASGGMALAHTRELVVDDDLSIMAAPTCRYTASQLGRTVELDAGDGVLMTNAEVGSMTLASDSDFITFRVPRASMAALLPNVEAAVARRIPAGNAALRLLVGYLHSVRDTGALIAPELQQITAEHIYDLLAVALGATRDAHEAAHGRGMRAARLQAAKAFIVQQIGRHDLSPQIVAAHLGVTPRYVHMLFEREGASFTQWVITQRLARSCEMLLDPRSAERSISAVAYAAGFGDLSHFNRTFRRHFGKTPSDARRAAFAVGE